MDLQTFIAETLSQIISAVSKAQKSTQDLGANINPDVRWPTYAALAENQIQKVQFDVAVTATEGKGQKAGIGVVMAIFGGGAQASSNTMNTNVSRVKFAVPLILPKGAQITK